MTKLEKHSNGYFLIDSINGNQIFIGESSNNAFVFVNRLLWDLQKLAEKERREKIEADNTMDPGCSK